MDAVHGNDIALGVEIAVLALPVVLRPEEVGLRALHVVLVAEPLAHQLVASELALVTPRSKILVWLVR